SGALRSGALSFTPATLTTPATYSADVEALAGKAQSVRNILGGRGYTTIRNTEQLVEELEVAGIKEPTYINKIKTEIAGGATVEKAIGNAHDDLFKPVPQTGGALPTIQIRDASGITSPISVSPQAAEDLKRLKALYKIDGLKGLGMGITDTGELIIGASGAARRAAAEDMISAAVKASRSFAPKLTGETATAQKLRQAGLKNLKSSALRVLAQAVGVLLFRVDVRPVRAEMDQSFNGHIVNYHIENVGWTVGDLPSVRELCVVDASSGKCIESLSFGLDRLCNSDYAACIHLLETGATSTHRAYALLTGVNSAKLDSKKLFESVFLPDAGPLTYEGKAKFVAKFLAQQDVLAIQQSSLPGGSGAGIDEEPKKEKSVQISGGSQAPAGAPPKTENTVKIS
ncbi:hypothetical protein HY991_03670, partial [Candidatus Micrarchaeota archaeon]|nr:hypothetical protein [Candidatus Micrarchaeota archaeon]